MSRLVSEYPAQAQPYQPAADDWRERTITRRGESGGSTLLIAGVIAIGLGALAWHYLGSDLRRYLKIRSM